MATEYVRYDLYYMENKHERGILAGLHDTKYYLTDDEIYQVIQAAVDVINYRLPVPDYLELGEDNEAFFTPEGFEEFRPFIEAIANAVSQVDGRWKAVMRREVIDETRIMYQDDYQIVAATVPGNYAKEYDEYGEEIQ